MHTRHIANRRPALQTEKPKGKQPPEFLLRSSKHTNNEITSEEFATPFHVEV
jgi:hypothetical protein